MAAIIAMVVSVVGTAPYAPSEASVVPLGGIRFVLPSAAESPEALAAHYERLRDEIVASGSPLLSDEELREEIRSRRGDRGL